MKTLVLPKNNEKLYQSSPPKILLVIPKNIPKLYDFILNENHNCKILTCKDTKDDIFSEVRGINAIIGCPRNLFDDELIEKAGENLCWVHCPGAGVEHFFSNKFISSKIVMTNGRIIQGPECADHALALLLTLTRNISRFIRNFENTNMPRPIELRGKNVLIVGAGGIGLNVAERISSFGTNVEVLDDDIVPMISFIKNQYFPNEIYKAVSDKDIVICCAPLTQKSHKIFNKELIKKFKPGSFFVNVSRGGLVDLNALVYGIQKKILLGVGIDVTDPEPIPSNHDLFNFENVVITNHIAGLSDHNRDRSMKLISENIKRFCIGETLLNIVNKRAGY